MARYVAFLRGVSPMNAKMAELRRCFEAAGITDVKTRRFGRAFHTVVRSSEALQGMLDAGPFAAFRLSAKAKRVVTFQRKTPRRRLSLPIEMHGARGREIFTAYVPSARGAAFMALIEKTFGREVTTRTWETVKKCAVA